MIYQEVLINDDLGTCKIMLRNYINAIIGFEKPGKELDKQPKSLRGMLSERRNPLAKKLSRIISSDFLTSVLILTSHNPLFLDERDPFRS